MNMDWEDYDELMGSVKQFIIGSVFAIVGTIAFLGVVMFMVKVFVLMAGLMFGPFDVPCEHAVTGEERVR